MSYPPELVGVVAGLNFLILLSGYLRGSVYDRVLKHYKKIDPDGHRSLLQRIPARTGGDYRLILPALLEALRSHPDDWVRARVASDLIGSADPPNTHADIEACLAVAEDTNEKVRHIATDLLLDSLKAGNKDAAPILATAMKDSRPGVRQWAMCLCRRMDVDQASRALDDLILGLDDPNKAVRQEALSTLERLGRKAGAAVPEVLLVAALSKHGSPPISNAAVRVLAAIDPDGERILQELPYRRERDWLAERLRRLGKGWLAQRLTDETWQSDVAAACEEVPPGAEAEAGQPIAAAREPQAVPGTEAGGEPSEAASDVGEAGRALSDKVEPEQPVEAAPPAVRAVTLSSGLSSYCLQHGDGQPVAVPAREGWKPIIALLVQKVMAGSPTEALSWDALTETVEEKPKKKPLPTDQALQTLHQRICQRICRLNKFLCRHLGCPPDGKKWLVVIPRQGVQLNPSVKWSVSEKLQQEMRSAFDHPVDPTVLAETLQNRDEKLPARSRRGQKQKKDDAVGGPDGYDDR
jgi:hypothetical protein